MLSEMIPVKLLNYYLYSFLKNLIICTSLKISCNSPRNILFNLYYPYITPLVSYKNLLTYTYIHFHNMVISIILDRKGYIYVMSRSAKLVNGLPVQVLKKGVSGFDFKKTRVPGSGLGFQKYVFSPCFF